MLLDGGHLLGLLLFELVENVVAVLELALELLNLRRGRRRLRRGPVAVTKDKVIIRRGIYCEKAARSPVSRSNSTQRRSERVGILEAAPQIFLLFPASNWISGQSFPPRSSLLSFIFPADKKSDGQDIQ